MYELHRTILHHFLIPMRSTPPPMIPLLAQISFDLFQTIDFDLSTISASVKALAKLGRSSFLSSDSIPSSPLERFVLSVFNFHTKRLNLRVPIGAGAELWSQRLNIPARDFVPWHRDKDESAFASNPSSPPRHPTVSTVTYLNDNESAATFVFGENNALAVFGREGEHLAFDGRMLHGVVRVGEGKQKTKRRRLECARSQ